MLPTDNEADRSGEADHTEREHPSSKEKDSARQLQQLEDSDSDLTVTSLIRRSQIDVNSCPATKPRVLIADDDAILREVLTEMVSRLECEAVAVADGADALDRLKFESFDLLLTDIEMPRMDGIQLLEDIKKDAELSEIPVIVISGNEDFESVIKCIEIGAEDYLPKPFNSILLKTRITASLDKKRLRDLELKRMRQLQNEREVSEALLLNVLPKEIGQRLKEGESPIADSFPSATIVFCDLVGFTQWVSAMPPREMVHCLNQIFSKFDELADIHGLEKIKTIGDAYLAVGGVPNPHPNHARACLEFAIQVQDALETFNFRNAMQLQLRIGIHSGPVVAGIIGKRKFIYDIWGDSVNIASRMESQGVAGRIHVSVSVQEQLTDQFAFEARDPIEIKGKGKMLTYLYSESAK